MIIATTAEEAGQAVQAWKSEGFTIGLVPTMGYLHEGHESLIKRSMADNDKTVVSVFVNPIQFGQGEDLSSYPRDFDRDSKQCRNLGVDMIFHPSAAEMYPSDFFTHVDVDVMTEGLCGSSRPGHFRGVCTVISKLFHIVTPDRAYFGQKDAQQLAVIQKMAGDLNFKTAVIGCPTIREADGLAKSSRNVHLTPAERRAAAIIPKALAQAAAEIESGMRNAGELENHLRSIIETEPLAEIDYVQIVDWQLLQPVTLLKKPALVAVAVKFGQTRLIDNYIWE